jgi:acetyl esterase/lipase
MNPSLLRTDQSISFAALSIPKTSPSPADQVAPASRDRKRTAIAASARGLSWRSKAAAALLPALLLLPRASSATNWFDLDYVGDGIAGHRLDIYQPPAGSPPYPLVVFIYGSAWQCDNCKSAVSHVLSALQGGGFAVASINHRSSYDAIYPAQIQDCKAAIRYLRANASAYDLDPDRFGATGSSSGGHLVALLGTSGGVTTYTVGDVTMDIEGSLGTYTGVSSRVQAVCDWYGPTDFLIMNECGSMLDHDAPDSPESLLMGGPIQEHPDECALANPITYVDSGDPPYRIFHGGSDPLVPHCESDSLDRALDAAGVYSDYTLVPGAGHGWNDGAEQAEMVVFFQTHLEEAAGVPGDETGADSKSRASLTILPSTPNPFRDHTTVRLELREASVVTLEVHDVGGRVVRTLPTQRWDAGDHSLQWNGRDDIGRPVPGGLYFLCARAGSRRAQQRLLLAR